MSVALFIIPAAAARLWTHTTEAMSALAAGLGLVSTTFGLTLAYHLATAPGATVALVAVALLALSVLATLPVGATDRPPTPATCLRSNSRTASGDRSIRHEPQTQLTSCGARGQRGLAGSRAEATTPREMRRRRCEIDSQRR
jgi:hypothetical protein